LALATRAAAENHRCAVRPIVVMSFVVVGLLAGCRPQHPFTWANDLPPIEIPVDTFPLRSGDVVAVTVQRLEELRAAPNFTVAADGTISLPLIGPFDVQGLTPEAAARKLNARLNGIVVNPDARISVINQREPTVSVVGEVNAPASFEIEAGAGVLEALARAGGITEFAAPDRIYVIRKYPKRLRVRFRYDDLTGGVERSAGFELRDGDVVVVE
jgi:polysaccharide export outer membrane protein